MRAGKAMGGQGTGVTEEAQANDGKRNGDFGLIGQQVSEQTYWGQEHPSICV